MSAELLSVELDPDCGCEFKRFLVNSIDLEMHIEPTGVDAVMDGGDWGEAEGRFPTEAAALEWAERMTSPKAGEP